MLSGPSHSACNSRVHRVRRVTARMTWATCEYSGIPRWSHDGFDLRRRETAGSGGTVGNSSPSRRCRVERRLPVGRPSDCRKASRSTEFLVQSSYQFHVIVVKYTQHGIFHLHHPEARSRAGPSALMLSRGRHHPRPERSSSYQRPWQSRRFAFSLVSQISLFPPPPSLWSLRAPYF